MSNNKRFILSKNLFKFGDKMENVNVIEPLTKLWLSIVDFLPSLVGSAIILFAGVVTGWILGRIVKEILVRFRIDERLKLPKRGIFSTRDVFPLITSWIIYLAFIQEALKQLRITMLTNFVSGIMRFLAGVLEGIIIILIGYAFGEYVSRKIRETKTPYSELVAKAVFFLVLYIAIALALPFVGIDPFIVNAILLVIIGSVGVGLAIAIGLGLKDTIARIAKKYESKLR
jgi:hypothetical protein